LLISEISISWLTFLAHKKTRSPWDFLPSGVCGPQLDSRVTCQLPSRFTRGENFKTIAYKIHCSLNEQNSLVQCLNDLQISCKWPLHPTENFTSAKVNPAMSVSLYVRMNAEIVRLSVYRMNAVISVWTLWSRKLCNRQYLSIDLNKWPQKIGHMNADVSKNIKNSCASQVSFLCSASCLEILAHRKFILA